MITIKLKYNVEDEDNKSLINDYLRQYSSCLHVFYLLLSKEPKLLSKFTYIKSDSICLNKFKHLNNVELINSWLVLCAIKEAYLLISEKLTKIIFGGKLNFIRRCKKYIDHDEFIKNKKLSSLYSIGTCKPYKGNRFFRINQDLSSIIFQPNKQTHIELKLNSLQHYKKILTELYKHQELKDFPITYKLDSLYVYISYDEKELLSDKYKSLVNKLIQNRVMSIDMNPNYVGWSIVDWLSSSEFKVIKSGVYSIKLLNDKEISYNKQNLDTSSKERIHINNKRVYDVSQICKSLINNAIYYRVLTFVIEDLNMKSKDKEKGKYYNRICNNLWCRNQFVNILQKRCNIYNIRFHKVMPNYTSFIGNFLFRSLNLPDMILASIEIGRRGYEFINQYINKIKQIKKNIIQPDISDFRHLFDKSLEEFGIQDKSLSLVKLYYIFKKSKTMYRLPIEHFILLFSKFFTQKSLVKQLYF